MPRNMSFMLTIEQYIDQTKTVTRRLGWWYTKAGDIQNGVEKSQGLKKGEKINHLGQHQVISTRPEPLLRLLEEPDYGHQECIKEGFPDMTPTQFVEMFCDTHSGCTPETVINRIEFRHLDKLVQVLAPDRCPYTIDMFNEA